LSGALTLHTLQWWQGAACVLVGFVLAACKVFFVATQVALATAVQVVEEEVTGPSLLLLWLRNWWKLLSLRA
jgi:hypothetical protein